MAAEHWLASLLPIRGVTFEMRFTEACSPGFFHQAALTAWLRRMLGSPDDYDLHLSIDALEQGFRHYRAGDPYRFSVIGIGETGADWLAQLTGLLNANEPSLHWDQAMPFRNNWQLNTMYSWPDAEALSPASTLPVIDFDQIQHYAASLGDSSVSLRLTAPWRVLRMAKGGQKHRGEMRYCRDSAHLQEQGLWLIRIGDALRDLARRRGAEVPARGETQPVDAAVDLFWVDASYQDAEKRRKPMGGVLGYLGAIQTQALTSEQLLMLVIGQFTGVGQRRAFGYGRYQLLDGKGAPLLQRVPARSWIERSLNHTNLEQAWREMADHDDDDAQLDGDEDIAQAADELPAEVSRLADKLLHESYAPPALNGFVHEDADGGLRPLAAPPLYDRVLQRAVHQTLSPMLDGIMDQGSYGFRTGRSRYQVRDLIQRLYRDGYRWVFESDIRSFFDMVGWPKLGARLQSLLGDDPLVDAIQEWMQSPVRWDGKLIRRYRGLPQGSPLSPVLANLMLDDFDHDLRDAGCRLIRFADDFVVVARNKEQAEEGGRLARKALEDVGLELHEGKTRTVPFSEGFRFLGFLFVDGMAVEATPVRSDDAGNPPPQSWLAAAMPEDQNSDTVSQLRGEDAVTLAPFRDTLRQLIFCGEPALLFSRADRLCIERDDQLLHQVPWSHLDTVILFGRHQVTTPALHEALKHHVPVHMASGSGRYLGVVSSGQAGAEQSAIWLQQQHCCDDQEWAMAAAKSVVDARIRHMAETLRRRQGLVDTSWKEQLESALRNVSGCTGRDELNGVEGHATRVYFEALKTVVPAVYGFDARNRRPPMDPFNALLSFGYTLLYAHVDSMLRADGLLPVKGFYHQSHGSHAALASDLMEPFRHVIERESLRMLQGNRLHPEDFSLEENGCRMSAAARRIYVAAITDALLKPVKAHGEHESFTILEHIHHQNLALRFAIAGTSSTFSAWRMR